jgi:hypothetical protein
MKADLQFDARAQNRMSYAALAKGAGLGVVGGLAGTVAMDLAMAGTFWALGLSPLAGFPIIGDTAAGFFALLGVNIAGGLPLGMAVYYLLGAVLGGAYGAAASRVDALRADTIKKGVLLAVVYIEVLSQPIALTAPLILKMPASEALTWLGMSAGMHLIWGIVLGFVVSYGLLRPAAAARLGVFWSKSRAAVAQSKDNPLPGLERLA